MRRLLAICVALAAAGIGFTHSSSLHAQSPEQVAPSAWSPTKMKQAWGGSTLFAAGPGAAATFTVRGRAFSMWYVANKNGGRVAVYVNGKRVRIVDQYSPKRQRRSVRFTGMRDRNEVRLIALSSRHSLSKGTRVNVDAFSPSPAACTRGCRRSPRVIAQDMPPTASDLEAIWYLTSVPTRDSDQWPVAIGSYVRGIDVNPIDVAAPIIREAACEQAQKVRQGIVVLSFGRQLATGTTGFGNPISPDTIVATAVAWSEGLAACGRGPWEVSIGTSNSGGKTPHNGFSGGKAWGEIVVRAQQEALPRVAISGSVDIEPGWGPAPQARKWVDGYVSATNIRLWNFGSADGCPQSVGRLTCGNGWTVDDVLWVSAHAGPNVIAMPQIHTQSGSQARQWAVLSARALELGKPLRIGAFTVQTAACAQVRGGCPTTGVSAWDGWTQLRTALDAIPITAGTLFGAPMDIRWGWGGRFVIPPPTSTTTTTVPPTSSTTTTTTVPPTTTTTTTTTTVAPEVTS